MSGPSPCERCGRAVPAGEASVSRRALRAVLCTGCRSGGRPDPDHEREAILEAREVGGYGLWAAEVDGEFVAGGFTKEGALQRARLVLANGRTRDGPRRPRVMRPMPVPSREVERRGSAVRRFGCW